MREWLGLMRAELLKVAKRRLTWGLLAALLVISIQHGRNLRTELLDYRQAQISGVGRFGQGVTPELAAATEANLLRRMSLPGFLDELWIITDMWALFAVIILACIQAGEEADLGTGRPVLLRGVSRLAWPAAKLAALLVAAGLVWSVLAIANLAIGLWTQNQAIGHIELSGVGLQRWADHGALLVRSWLTTTPYLAFAIAAATLARGAGPALALGLGGRFVEAGSIVVGAILIGMESMGSSALAALYRIWAPLHVVSFEWSAEVIRTWGHPSWIQPFSPTAIGEETFRLPSPFFDSPSLAVLLLLGWTALWLAVSAGVLQRRDICA
jgi:hypothetical protein